MDELVGRKEPIELCAQSTTSPKALTTKAICAVNLQRNLRRRLLTAFSRLLYWVPTKPLKDLLARTVYVSTVANKLGDLFESLSTKFFALRIKFKRSKKISTTQVAKWSIPCFNWTSGCVYYLVCNCIRNNLQVMQLWVLKSTASHYFSEQPFRHGSLKFTQMFRLQKCYGLRKVSS
mgnify:CR=1 FL=1